MSNGEICLGDKVRYYLYGAGTLGKILGEFLLKKGFIIEGYIDKRANELTSLLHIPVITLNDLGEDTSNVCVIIAIKDVFEHEKIKNILLDRGIDKIIYKAQGVLDGNGTFIEKQISILYDSIVNFSFKKNTALPLIEKGLNVKKKEWILEETEENFIVYLPGELIYTNYDEKDRYTWGNICIFALVPHIELFRFFAGSKEYDEKEYIKFCIQNAVLQGIKITNNWKKNVLRNRNNVFHQMFYYWSVDQNFFIRNAPTANWNLNGYFNLTSGKHRAAFLIAMGQRWLPCKICKKDYAKWKNEVECVKYQKAIDAKIIKPRLLIEHPLYMDQRNSEYQIWNDILKIIEFWICKMTLNCNGGPSYKGKTFYNNCNSEGYIERNIRKFGLKVINGVQLNLEGKYANQLLLGENFNLLVDLKEAEYDFGLLDWRNTYGLNENIKCAFIILNREEDVKRYSKANLLYKNYYGEDRIYLIGCNNELID